MTNHSENHLNTIISKKVLSLIMLLAPTIGHADWDSLGYALDEARTLLERVSKSTDLDDAKNNIRRAKNALEDAALAASDIDCPSGYMELDDAATKARRARDADGVEEFNDNYRRTIRSYNDALVYLRQCAQ